LVDAGFDVAGLDTYFYRQCVFGEDVRWDQAVSKDVRDIAVRDLEGLDAVIHLAALSNDPLGDLHPELTYDINLRGTIELARMAREAGVKRFLLSSSCSVYGTSKGDVANEDSRLEPLTAYAISKVKSEEAISKMADASFSPVFMRNATAYGVSPRLRMDLMVNNLVGWAQTTGKIVIMSDGTPWRPLVHIADISSAFIAALKAPVDAIHNQAINVGSDNQNYQVRDVADIVRDTVPGSQLEYAAGGGPDARDYQVSFAKLGRLLPDFVAEWDVVRGARQLDDAFSCIGIEESDLRGGRRYIRLQQLRHLLDTGALDSDLRWARAD
jgi:nucleoside-diphosphate-sugar epimerase